MASTCRVDSQKYDGRYMYLSCTQTPDIATNSSTIKWTLTATGGSSNYYTTGPTTVKINGETVYYKAKVYWDAYEFPASKGSKSGTIVVPHDDDGTKTIEISIKTNIYTGVLQTNSATWELNKIDRYATLLTAPNFTDVQNPQITYSNPAGDIVEELQACISFDGSAADIPYRDIPKDGSSYTFALTDEERVILRYNTNDGSEVRTVNFYVRTKIGGEYFYSSLTKQLTIVDCMPDIRIAYEDDDSLTASLTGDNQKAIKGYSDIKVDIAASSVKNSAITELSLVNGTTTRGGVIADAAPILGLDTTQALLTTFTNVTDNKLSYTVKDTRGHIINNSVSFQMIEYFKPTCDVSVELELDGETTVRANMVISGSFFNQSFGAENNSLEILILHSAADGWISLQNDLGFDYTTDGDKYSIDFGISNLDYTQPFTYQVKVVDKLDSVMTTAKTVNYLPVYDWGAEDFNLNVRMKMSGNTVLRHTEENKVVLSAEGADIYLRPNGTTTDSGQLRLFTDGKATLNGSRILTVDMVYPVGSIYMSMNDVNPTNFFGGTWARIEGRFLLGASSSYTVGSTGGEATHTLTVDEMPSHRHTISRISKAVSSGTNYSRITSDGTELSYTNYTGGGEAHNNMPPYLTVYMWKRTA